MHQSLMRKMILDLSDLYLWIKLHQGPCTIQSRQESLSRGLLIQPYLKQSDINVHEREYIIKKNVILYKVKTIKYFMWFGDI